jgi:hypothetical protein
LELEQSTLSSIPTEALSTEAKISTVFEADLRIIEHTALDVDVVTQTTQKSTRPVFRRQLIIEEASIFPSKDDGDPYTPALFQNFTGLDPKRVTRRSAQKVHKFIKELNFRAFISEMSMYIRRIPFRQLYSDSADNADGLYYRTAFYLLLRALEFVPTDYFRHMWDEYGVLAVETPATVLLFAVELYPEAEDDFKVTENIVEGESGTLLPRDTKTILCAGISFDREFHCKIRHWKAVLRDKTIPKSKRNVTESAKDEGTNTN